MDDDARRLSSEFDEALYNEEYHRDQLLYWKQRRRELEKFIPHSKTWSEILDLLQRSIGHAFHDN